jgi:hypothetical protein
VVPAPRNPQEAESLRALAETLTVTQTGRALPRVTGREGPDIVRCRECAAALAPAASGRVHCSYCQTENEMPVALADKVRALGKLSATRRRDERILRALTRQPGPWLANVIAFGGGTILLGAAVLTLLMTSAFAFVDGQEAGMPRLHGVGPIWMGICLLLFASAIWLLATRRALRVLTLGFGAIAPDRTGAPYACRECAGPLPQPPEKASLVDCVYCQTTNVRAVDARIHAAALPKTAPSPHEVLIGVARRRRRAGYLAFAALALIAGGIVWSRMFEPLELDERDAVEVPFVEKKSQFDPNAIVEAADGAARVERVGRFGELRLTLVAGDDGRVSMVLQGDEMVTLREVHESAPVNIGHARLWAHHDDELWALSRRGIDVLDDDGEHIRSVDDTWADPVIVSMRGGGSRVLLTTRASPQGHLRVREIDERELDAPILFEDVREATPSPASDAIAITLLVAERFQLAVTEDEKTARLLTRGRGHVACPTWSPDGKRIAFVTRTVRDAIQFGTRYGRRDLWVVSADGGDLAQLTTGAQIERACPAWGNDGIYVVTRERAEPTRPFETTLLRVVPN